ncbi:hypothetical protein SEVIR_7G109350v4 [Setaria viridis]
MSDENHGADVGRAGDCSWWVQWSTHGEFPLENKRSLPTAATRSYVRRVRFQVFYTLQYRTHCRDTILRAPGKNTPSYPLPRHDLRAPGTVCLRGTTPVRGAHLMRVCRFPTIHDMGLKFFRFDARGGQRDGRIWLPVPISLLRSPLGLPRQ